MVIERRRFCCFCCSCYWCSVASVKVCERVFPNAFLYLRICSAELSAVLFAFICQFAQQYNTTHKLVKYAQCLGTHTLRTIYCTNNRYLFAFYTVLIRYSHSLKWIESHEHLPIKQPPILVSFVLSVGKKENATTKIEKLFSIFEIFEASSVGMVCYWYMTMGTL